MLMVGFLILILLIPSAMISELIRERQYRQQDAVDEVSSKWSESQMLVGPIIMIPFEKTTPLADGTTSTVVENAYLLPDVFDVTADIQPEIRRRGIYDVLLYRSDVVLKGSFPRPRASMWNIDEEKMHWDEATMIMGMSDLRGVREKIDLRFGGVQHFFSPGLPSSEVLTTGVSSPVVFSSGDTVPFEISLNLLGSDSLETVPVGKENNVQFTSSWNTPSFTGAFLPDESVVNDSGFTAKWKLFELNRNFPQAWIGRAYEFKDFAGADPLDLRNDEYYGPQKAAVGSDRMTESSFGVRLLVPVDAYQKTERSAKYMVLFIFLTFLVFFFVEVLGRRRIHPIQYLLVGFALLVFYVLLLSISEYLGFGWAYLIGSVATVSLISSYSLSIFKYKKLSLLLFGILSILYGFLYTLLQLEDYALLLGSIGLFVILCVLMFITRKVDWYRQEEAVS